MVPSSNHEREANWRVDRIINRFVARFAAGLCILVLLVLPVKTFAQEVPELEINSRAYIVLDADTGEIYAQRNAHDQRAIGSLTKIFSTIEAIERASLTTEVTTSEWDYVPEDASVMGFTAGDTFTLEELLYGMMLPSGNDAAHAVARSVGRTSDDMSDTDAFRQFVNWMNLRVQAMGLVDTHLKNPDGWGVPDHHSSAYDLATFTRYALRYPEFEKLISTKTYETDNGYNLNNNNGLLGESPSIVGGKTGYDWDAGWCLVEVARRGDTTMISVTLDGVHDDGDWYDDNVVLLDYAFDQKEKREERGEAFEGDVAAYVDPSAALVAKSFAAAGSTTGQRAVTKAQGTPEPTAVPDSLFDSARPTVVAPVQPNSVSNSGGSDSSGFRLLAVAAVAVLVVGVRFADAWRRDPAGNPWTLKSKQALVSNEVLADVGDTQQMDPVMENGGEN